MHVSAGVETTHILYKGHAILQTAMAFQIYPLVHLLQLLRNKDVRIRVFDLCQLSWKQVELGEAGLR